MRLRQCLTLPRLVNARQGNGWVGVFLATGTHLTKRPTETISLRTWWWGGGEECQH